MVTSVLLSVCFQTKCAVLFCLAAVAAFAQEAGSIQGRVVGPDRSPVGGVNVTLLRDGATLAATISNGEGRFNFDKLQAGAYQLHFQLGQGSSEEPSVQVRPGQATSIEKTVVFDVGAVETVTVYSASRQLERLIDAPAAVSSVSDTDVQLFAATGMIPNALAALPGVMTAQAGLFDYDMNVRGMDILLNRRLQTLVDGRDPSIMFLSSQDWAALSLMTDDLEPVEMLRGPSGAFYGANSFNGVINMRTKAPRDSLGGTLRFSLGDPAQYKAETRWARDLGKGWYFKLTGGFNRADSFAVSRNVTVEYPGVPKEAVPLPTHTTQIFAGSARADKYLSDGRVLTFEGGGDSMSGLLLLTSTGRSFADGIRSWARFHLEDDHWDVLAYENTRASNDVIALSSGAPIWEHEATGAGEARYRWSWGRNHFVAGTEYAIEHVNTANPQGVQTLLSMPVLTNKGAFYGQFDRKLTESLSIELGARFDASTLHSPQFSRRAAAVYELTPHHSLRASYNEGFEVASHIELFLDRPIGLPLNLSAIQNALAPLLGGVSLGLNSVPLIALGNPNLLVEHIRTAEAGYKAILGGRGFFSVDYYHNWMKNFISDVFPGGNPDIPKYVAPSTLPPSVQAIVTSTLNNAVPGLSNLPGGAPYVALSLTNTGQVESEGVETELESEIVRHWQMGANYAYFNFHIGEQKPGTQVHPNAPRNTFSTFGGYRSARFNADLRYRWVEHLYWANGLLTGPVPSYGVVDLGAVYDLSRHYKLGVEVDNLANNAHYEVFGGDILKRRTLGYVAYTW